MFGDGRSSIAPSTVFGAEVGFSLLRERFGDVRWYQYEDELRCSDPAAVLAYSCSSPPGEDATADAATVALESAIADALRGRRRRDDDHQGQRLLRVPIAPALAAWPGPVDAYSRSMIVTLAWPPPSHMVCRP